MRAGTIAAAIALLWSVGNAAHAAPPSATPTAPAAKSSKPAKATKSTKPKPSAANRKAHAKATASHKKSPATEPAASKPAANHTAAAKSESAKSEPAKPADHVAAKTAGTSAALPAVAAAAGANPPTTPPDTAAHGHTLSISEATEMLRVIESQPPATTSAVPPTASAATSAPAAAPEAAAPASTSDRIGNLVSNALSYIGVRYRYGGNTPEHGFDCSGLVRWVYNRTWGVMLPRRASEIAKVGTDIPKDQLKPGDLVFFNTLRRTFSHVGIYLGDGQFLHAPRSGGKVRVEKLDESYWAKRWDGARRLEDAPTALDTSPPPTTLIEASTAAPKLH